MHDASSWNMIKGVSRHFSAIYENVVSSGCSGMNAHFVQYEYYEIDVFIKGEAYVFLLCNILKQYVAHVGIYASSTAFPTICLYFMFTAIVKVYFVVNQLVTSEYYGGIYLPHKETFIAVVRACNVFFHCEIEAELPLACVGQVDV